MTANASLGNPDLSGPAGYSALAASLRWPQAAPKPAATQPDATVAPRPAPDLSPVPNDPKATIRRAENVEATALAAHSVETHRIVYDARVAALAASIELAASRLRQTLHDNNVDELDARTGATASTQAKVTETLFGSVRSASQIDFTA